MNKVIGIILVTLVLYCGWIAYSGFDEVYQGFQQVGWGGLAILIGLSLVNYTLRFIRWHWMLARITRVKVPLADNFNCYMAGFAFTATPGKVGEAMRSYYLLPYGIKAHYSLAALYAERLFDLSAVLIIGGLALFEFSQYRWIGILVVLLVIVATVLVRLPFVPSLLKKLQQNTARVRLKSLLGHSAGTIESAGQFMSGPIWAVGLILGLLAWGAEAWGFALLLNWLTGENWLLLAAGIYCLGMIAGAISFLPGGLGGAEAVMAATLLALGIGMADATAATIICRAVTLWFAIMLGLFFVIKVRQTPGQTPKQRKILLNE